MLPFQGIQRIYFLVIVLFSAVPAFAKSRFYLKPSVGIGASSIISNYKDADPDVNKTRQVLSYQIIAGIGYRINKLQIESGIGIMKTGVRGVGYVSGIIEFSKINYHDNFYYAALPLRLGYEFNLTPKLSLQPAIGALFTYNMRGPLGGRIRSIPPHNVWGEVRVNANYQIGKLLTCLLGPPFNVCFLT
ncbi:MAG: hypothetical protein EOP56_01405 [Sphingobacteriales bacterium]|nr:MAG: hypothetical protein EOP56_01405 [Sphingobacteriales bacterium]